MNINSNTLIGIVSGLAAGAILGVLFAPRKGASTRDNIAFNMEYLGEVAKEKISEVKEDLQQVAAPIKKKKTAVN